MNRVYKKIVSLVVLTLIFSMLFPKVFFYWFIYPSLGQEVGKHIHDNLSNITHLLETEELTLNQVEKVYLSPSFSFNAMYTIDELEAMGLSPQQMKSLNDGEIIFKFANGLVTKPSKLTAVAPCQYKGAQHYLTLTLDLTDVVREAVALDVRAFLVSFILGLITVLAVNKRIFLPVLVLTDATKRIMQGDLNVDIPKSDKWGRDEISRLVENFNQMVTQLNQMQMLNKNFISFFTHELKGPISSIIGYIQLLERRLENYSPADEKDCKDYIGIVKDEASQLATLSENVLLLNRLENKNVFEEPEKIAVAEQLRRTFAAFESRWSQKKIELELQLDEVEITGYPWMLTHVWKNLIDNAIKFSPEGGIIEAKLRHKDGKAVLTIRNEGEPIPADKIDRVFDRFFCGGNVRDARGNGMGTTVIKQIVEMHGGNVTVESNALDGTTFTVTL